MANNYDFMFKFIIIGDSSTSDITQALESHASCSGSPKAGSRPIINPHSEFSLAPEISPSTIIPSKYRYGTQ